MLIGFLQEYSSKKTLEKLQSFIKSQSLVIRNSKREMIDSKLLVPGDILVLLKGDKVTADGIVLNANDFFVSEAFLTGESELINKNKKNEVFAGSYVLGGTAIVKVTRTARTTKYGQIISKLASLEHEKAFSQKLISKFSNKLILLAGTIAVLIISLASIRGENVLDAIRYAIMIGVTVIPESLIVIITLTLTVGAKRILKRNELVKKLTSVENLGLTTVLCIDWHTY